MLPGTTSICLLSFVCVSFFFCHASRWSTTNHNSLTFFTTSTGRSLLLSCLKGRIFSQSIMPQPRRLYINQYGSNLDPRTMEQGDFMDIELSSSISDLVYETSQKASRAHSNSSASEASTGVRNELSSSSPLL